MVKNSCIFLDRDGVINRERGRYTYLLEDFEILPEVIGGLKLLKEVGYLLIMVTNQSGISKNIYTRRQMNNCHQLLQKECGEIINHIYYSPYAPTISESLTRKPDSLMFEKAIAKYDIDPKRSWMIGDKDRDLIPAKKLSIRTVLISDEIESEFADYHRQTFSDAVQVILTKQTPLPRGM